MRGIADYRAAHLPVNRTRARLRARLTAWGRDLDSDAIGRCRDEKGCRHVCRPARNQRRPQGMEGGQSGAAVGKCEGASAGAAARRRLPVVVGQDPSADHRRHRGRLAGGGGTARAATRAADPRVPGRAADLAHPRRQHPDPVAGREGAAASPHHERVAVRARRLRRVHHRRRQVLSDGGRGPDPHPGLDLARARSSGQRSDHLARCPRRAVPAIYGDGCVPARAGCRDAGDRRRRRLCRGQCRAGYQLCHEGLFAGVPLSLCEHVGCGCRRAVLRAMARAACATSTRSPAAPGWR